MFGVSVPVILASLGNTAAIVIGVAMSLSGALLVASIRYTRAKYQFLLLLLNALIATVILIGILSTKPHTFLVVWSLLIIVLAGLSMWLLRSRGSV